ncbi:MAG: hypothetical protein AAF841_06940 [Pseudomonadota bacterium]
MSAGTVMVVHHETDHPPLKAHVDNVIAAHKDAGVKHYTYKPLHGPAGVSYVYMPHADEGMKASASSGAATAGAKDMLAASAEAAKGAVKGVGAAGMKTVASTNSGKGPAPFVLAIGVKAKAGKMGELMDAGKMIKEAHSAAESALRFSLHMADDMADTALVLLHMDSLGEMDPDGPVSAPILAKHLGEEEASKVGAMLMDAIDHVWQHPMRLVPHLSAH